MFYSERYKLLFIASPKTGTVSIHEALEQIDPEGERRKIHIDGRIITSQDMHFGVLGHARAWELRSAIGAEAYDALDTMAFIRNPYAKLVSSYFFNKERSLSTPFAIKGKKRRLVRMASMFFTILIPKILPFQLWALIYPMKTNLDYVADRQGKRIVKHIGRTENLVGDFYKILDRLRIDRGSVIVHQRNTSGHEKYEAYFKGVFFKKIITRRFARDIAFYEAVTKEMN